MRFNTTKFSLACAAVLAVAVGCKHSSSSGNMNGSESGSAADGGMAAAGSSGSSSMMASDGGMGGAMNDMSNKATTTANSGMAAGMGMADAGMAAANGAAATGATTASDAAKTASDTGAAMADAGTAAAGAATTAATGAASGAASGAAGAAASAAGLSDAQIAGATAASNKSEIDAAKLAHKTSKNAKVRKFAAEMEKDHGAAMKDETAITTKAGITPADSDLSAKIKQMGSDSMDKLKTLKGKDFDKAYVQSQVDAHQTVLDSLDNALIPAAQNADLKAQLQKERAKVATHLEHAKKLNDELSK